MKRLCAHARLPIASIVLFSCYIAANLAADSLNDNHERQKCPFTRAEWTSLRNVERLMCNANKAYVTNTEAFRTIINEQLSINRTIVNATGHEVQITGASCFLPAEDFLELKQLTVQNQTIHQYIPTHHDWRNSQASKCNLTSSRISSFLQQYHGYLGIERIPEIADSEVEPWDLNSTTPHEKLCFPKLAWDWNFFFNYQKNWKNSILFVDEFNGFKSDGLSINTSYFPNYANLRSITYTPGMPMNPNLPGFSLGKDLDIKRGVVSPIIPYGYRVTFVCPDAYDPPEGMNITIDCVEATSDHPLNMPYTYNYTKTSEDILNNCDICNEIRQSDLSDDSTGKMLAFMGRYMPLIFYISIPALVVALAIMLGFRKLRCQVRNQLHSMMLLSFLLKAIATVTYLKIGDSFDTESMIYLRGDLANQQKFCENQEFYKATSLRLWCRFMQVFYKYSFMSNMMWLLIEGFHLYSLLTKAFSDRSPMVMYLCIGWGVPIPFVAAWVIIRKQFTGADCWNIEHHYIKWVIQGPFTLSFVLCILMFIYIVSVVYKKTRAVSADDANKRLMHSFISLFPLLGVHYVFSRWMPAEGAGVPFWILFTRMAIENFFDSIQGLAVSLIYVFCNREVQGEIKDLYQRRKVNQELRDSAYRRCSTASQSRMTRLKQSGGSSPGMQSPGVNGESSPMLSKH